MKSLKEKIEVMQAALDGKEIEFNFGSGWSGFIEDSPVWDWNTNDYRIKQDPMVRYVVVFDDGNNSGRTYKTKEAAVREWGELTSFKRVIKLVEVTE